MDSRFPNRCQISSQQNIGSSSGTKYCLFEFPKPLAASDLHKAEPPKQGESKRALVASSDHLGMEEVGFALFVQ